MLIWRAIIIINTVLGVPYYKYAKKGGRLLMSSLCRFAVLWMLVLLRALGL